jgi:hypothetical protein
MYGNSESFKGLNLRNWENAGNLEESFAKIFTYSFAFQDIFLPKVYK